MKIIETTFESIIVDYGLNAPYIYRNFDSNEKITLFCEKHQKDCTHTHMAIKNEINEWIFICSDCYREFLLKYLVPAKIIPYINEV